MRRHILRSLNDTSTASFLRLTRDPLSAPIKWRRNWSMPAQKNGGYLGLTKRTSSVDIVMKQSNSAMKSTPHIASTNNGQSHMMSNSNVSDYKLHLVMDKESFARLSWLKGAMEATTESEVIRRALKVYDLFEPNDLNKGDARKLCPDNDRNVEHLYIRLPVRMKERLDAERNASGLSYGEQVRHALRVLTQLVRDRERLLSSIRTEGCDVNVAPDCDVGPTDGPSNPTNCDDKSRRPNTNGHVSHKDEATYLRVLAIC